MLIKTMFVFGKNNLRQIINKCSQSKKYPEIEVKTRYLLGKILVAEVLLAPSIENANSALNLALQYNDLKAQGDFYNQLGNIYELMGADYYVEAQKFYEKALEITILLEDQLGQANTYNNLGNILEKLNDLDEAIKLYQKSLEIFQKNSSKSGECTIYTNLGALCQKKGDFKSAIKYQIEAFKLARELKQYTTEANACLNLGYCYFALDDFAAALNYFQKTLVIVNNAGDGERQIKALKGAGDCYVGLNESEKAKFYYQQTIPHLELMQENLTVAERRSFLNQYLEIYQSLVSICIKTDDFIKAFFYVEHFRNRYLVERLAKYDAAMPTTGSEELSKRIEDAKLRERQTLKRYTDGLSKNLDRQKITELSCECSEAKTALEHLYNKVATIEPEFIIKTKVYPISFTEVQSLLPTDTAIIEFFFTETKLFTMLILPGSAAPICPPDLCLVAKHIYLESIGKSWISDITADYYKKDVTIDEIIADFPSRINRISELLRFTNLLDYIDNKNITNLILIPHNYLHLFPIHSLWLNAEQRVIDRFFVKYFPNLMVGKICQNRKRDHWRFLGIENPTQDEKLIFAKVEVASVSESRYFVDSKIICSGEASKSVIIETAKQNECFHFSGHAKYNFTNPLESYLQLSENHQENLTLSDIFADLHLPQTDLVTLSACCTGVVDAFQPTDEYLGLPTGFLLAGAKAVVSSLWKVNSISTAFLLDEFYRQLAQNPDKAVALQNAQNWLRTCNADDLRQRAKEWDLSKIESKEKWFLNKALKQLQGCPFENPYYWAAFILTGY